MNSEKSRDRRVERCIEDVCALRTLVIIKKRQYELHARINVHVHRPQHINMKKKKKKDENEKRNQNPEKIAS